MYALGQSLLERLELLAQAYVRLLQECRACCHLMLLVYQPRWDQYQACRSLSTKFACRNRHETDLPTVHKSEKTYVCIVTALRQGTKHSYLQAGQMRNSVRHPTRACRL